MIDRQDDIKNLIAEILEIDPSEMTETSRFREDHRADSLAIVEILATLEMELKVEIPQSEVPYMSNLAGVYEVLKKLRETE